MPGGGGACNTLVSTSGFPTDRCVVRAPNAPAEDSLPSAPEEAVEDDTGFLRRAALIADVPAND